MKYRKFGNTGLTVSEVGFGAWQLGAKLWQGAQDDEAIRLVHEAIEGGCNFFDTAPGYGDGNSEKLLGQALKYKRKDVVIVSKFGHNPDGTTDFSAGRIRDAVNRSLEALQTDYLDGILLHNPPTDILKGKEGHYDIFEELKNEGLINAYGASVDSSEDLKIVMDNSKSQIAEIYFHALHQEMAVAFEAAAKREMGLIVKVPLDSGWLAGKYTKETMFNTGYRERWTQEVKNRRFELVEQLRFLEHDNQSMAQAALRFILSYPEIATVIPGSKNSTYLKNNLAASDERLSDEEIKKVINLWEEQIKSDMLPW